jgi:hypothetical protein
LSADARARAIAADARDAQENPLYAVKVRYRSADSVRAHRLAPIDPRLPGDARIGILDHEVAYDPKYGRDEDENPS